MGTTVRAGDPEAMGALALLLDDVAGQIDVHRAVARAAAATSGAPPPALVGLREVTAWLRSRADDLRRRALDLLSADRRWRQGGLLDRLTGVARAGLSGMVDGVEGMATGTAAAGRI